MTEQSSTEQLNLNTDAQEESELSSITKNRKRFFFFYNRPIQIRYAATALFIIFATVLAYTYILYSQVSKVIGTTHININYDSEALGALAMQNFIHGIIWGSASCVLIAGGASAIWAMLISHRYEGPIVRINLHLHELAKGNYKYPLVIRKNDEVQTLVETVNTLTAALQKREAEKS